MPSLLFGTYETLSPTIYIIVTINVKYHTYSFKVQTKKTILKSKKHYSEKLFLDLKKLPFFKVYNPKMGITFTKRFVPLAFNETR